MYQYGCCGLLPKLRNQCTKGELKKVTALALNLQVFVVRWFECPAHGVLTTYLALSVYDRILQFIPQPVVNLASYLVGLKLKFGVQL